MASINELTLKTLVEVLKDLRGGSIGFDPFRNAETNTKAKLLGFILKEHINSDIIAAISRVTEQQAQAASSKEAPKAGDSSQDAASTAIYVVYQPIGGELQARKFESESVELSQQMAASWIGNNPQHSFKARLTELEWSSKREGDHFFGLTVKMHPEKAIIKASNFTFDPKGNFGKTEKRKGFEAPFINNADSKLDALKKLLAPEIDDAKIHSIMDARAQDYVDNILNAVNQRLNHYDSKIDSLQMPVTVHVLKADTAKPVDLGHQHKHFPNLLKMAQARTKDGMRLNIWLKGPAGSGKTTAAKKVSEALAMQFQFNGAISTEYELMGFKDASGAYHRTAFREVFEHGGVYLFDEVDSSLPKAVLAFNAALANGECRFPDAMINRHPDCVILAGANTAGNGANSDYVGRMKQDLAFLNRFVMLDWPLDEALEKALASNKDWVRKVQWFRSNANKRGIKGHIISPRATFYGEALLAAGLDEEAVEQAVLRGALTDDQWGQLCQ